MWVYTFSPFYSQASRKKLIFSISTLDSLLSSLCAAFHPYLHWNCSYWSPWAPESSSHSSLFMALHMADLILKQLPLWPRQHHLFVVLSPPGWTVLDFICRLVLIWPFPKPGPRFFHLYAPPWGSSPHPQISFLSAGHPLSWPRAVLPVTDWPSPLASLVVKFSLTRLILTPWSQPSISASMLTWFFIVVPLGVRDRLSMQSCEPSF